MIALNQRDIHAHPANHVVLAKQTSLVKIIMVNVTKTMLAHYWIAEIYLNVLIKSIIRYMWYYSRFF